MAHFYPNTQAAWVPVSEKRVFEALRKLGDDWIVLHGLRFVVPARGRFAPRNGEADFVLVHPRQGLIVLEVKGGHYEIERGRWFTFPAGKRTPMSRSPFAQATQNRYDLAEHLTDATGIRGLPFGHAVAFPDGAPSGDLGPEAPRAIIVDGTEIAELPEAVRRICSHWFTGNRAGIAKKEFDQVLAVLAPTARVSADKRYSVDVTMVDVRQLTERQIQFTSEQLDVIQATQPGAFVSVLGAAGTGKTVIASHRAARLANAGLRVTFIADQRYLHGALLKQPSLRHPNLILGTPGEVLRKLAPGLLDSGPGRPLWEGYIEAAESGAIVDAVIIDEAQSHDDDLLEAIRSLCPDSCQLYADPYQRDSSGMWRPPGSPHTFWLTQNCRNSLPIARLAARLSGSLAPHDGPAGTPIRFVEAEQDRALFRVQFITILDELLKNLEPAEIAVLSCAPELGELRKMVTGHGVRPARRPGDEGITLLPASEFRGCEAPAVLLVSGPDHECGPSAATNHYVAVSRAVADLTVIGNAADWHSTRFLMES